MRYFYDLHLHSCLSPCGDDQMSPYNIANMAALAGYQIIAVTDHNTTRNCPAVLAAAKTAGIIAIPGMELTTAEEVHVICLLPNLEAALEWDSYVYQRLPKIANNSMIFGHQLLMDENDSVVGEEERLLISAAAISVFEISELISAYGGVAFPAHIDRPSFSLLSNLVYCDPSLNFTVMEITEYCDREKLVLHNPELALFPYIINSDAHNLFDMKDAKYSLSLAEKSIDAVLDSIAKGQLIGTL